MSSPARTCPSPTAHRGRLAVSPTLTGRAHSTTREGVVVPRDDTPLRVALIATSRYPVRQPFAGGLEALVWHLAHTLRQRGHEVTLFAAEGSDGGDPEFAFPPGGWDASRLAEQDSSMPARTFMSDHHGYLRLMMALTDRLRDEFDVIHNHSLHHLPPAMAPLLRTPMVTTLHTPPTPWLESAIEVAGAAGTAFTCVSGHTARQWQIGGTLPQVVRNGVDPTRWPAGAGGDGLFWSGRIVPEKAPHLAIDAARRAGMSLRLAGPLSDLPYFEQAIRPRLGADVQYLGHVGQSDLAQAIGDSAAVLVTPMWDEPYGLVVAEAMACGTPVVAFSRGGIPEVLRHAHLGRLVPAGDVAALAAAIPEAVELPRAPIRAYVQDHLSLDRMTDEYVEVYRGLSGPTAQERPSGARWARPSAANAASHPSIGNQPQRR